MDFKHCALSSSKKQPKDSKIMEKHNRVKREHSEHATTGSDKRSIVESLGTLPHQDKQGAVRSMTQAAFKPSATDESVSGPHDLSVTYPRTAGATLKVKHIQTSWLSRRLESARGNQERKVPGNRSMGREEREGEWFGHRRVFIVGSSGSVRTQVNIGPLDHHNWPSEL